MELQILCGFIAITILYISIIFILKRIGKNPNYILPKSLFLKIKFPLGILLLTFFINFLKKELTTLVPYQFYTSAILKISYVLSITWIILSFLKSITVNIAKKQDIKASDNLKARKIYTQLKILERVTSFIIIIVAIGILLMSFENIRQVGISVLTSAGIAGIILGFAAQKALSTLLAGIQIAFTQPIRLDDVVIVENEWGTIEEINLTYVVVKIWDKRRLVVPTTYFIEKPFQNWTRNSADILGTVFIYTDYKIDINILRNAQTSILNNTDLWDQQVNVIQVTNTMKDMIEIRCLVSAKDSPTSWDLRVYLREQLVLFLQKNYPDSLPHSHIKLKPLESKSKKW